MFSSLTFNKAILSSSIQLKFWTQRFKIEFDLIRPRIKNQLTRALRGTLDFVLLHTKKI